MPWWAWHSTPDVSSFQPSESVRKSAIRSAPMRHYAPLAAVLLSVTFAGCARQTAGFSEQNAMAHVAMLAGTIGSRPVGSAENARARTYIVDQLRAAGFEVRV